MQGFEAKIVATGAFLSLVSRSSLGLGVVKTGGYKQGQETQKKVKKGQKVMMVVIYINFTRPYINFCFSDSAYYQHVKRRKYKSRNLDINGFL